MDGFHRCTGDRIDQLSKWPYVGDEGEGRDKDDAESVDKLASDVGKNIFISVMDGINVIF